MWDQNGDERDEEGRKERTKKREKGKREKISAVGGGAHLLAVHLDADRPRALFARLLP